MSSAAELSVVVDGHELRVAEGTSVAAAVAIAGVDAFRVSPDGAPRGPLCGMGICFECRVELDGRHGVRSCQTSCRDGMVVRTSHA
jgi:predicted molibdopterin-dependent oxidoreductase YjgC